MVQVLSGGKRTSLMRRPVQRLIPLEVNDREEDHSTHSEVRLVLRVRHQVKLLAS